MTSAVTLEDVAFGPVPMHPYVALDDNNLRHRTAVVRPSLVGGPAQGAVANDAACGAVWTPLLATTVVVLVVCYSLCKTVEYNELFSGSKRYRVMLLGLNTIAVAIGALVVWYTASH